MVKNLHELFYAMKKTVFFFFLAFFFDKFCRVRILFFFGKSTLKEFERLLGIGVAKGGNGCSKFSQLVIL